MSGRRTRVSLKLVEVGSRVAPCGSTIGGFDSRPALLTTGAR